MSRSLTEWVVLGLLAEGPTHGFALARQLTPGSEVGRVLTVRRPLAYRALDRLVADGLAAPQRTEPGDAGPQRTIHRITPAGRRRLDAWLDKPVDHVRDLRIEFLLKLVLLRRTGRSPAALIGRQRSRLAETLRALEAGADEDEVALWRHHSALAVASFLDALEGRRWRHGSGRTPEPNRSSW